MTGIVAGTAALVGAALGWWGAVMIALLAVLALAIGSNRAPWAVCAVALAAVVLGAWRAEALPQPGETGHLVQDARSAVVVTAPVLAGQRQHFAVVPTVHAGPTGTGPSTRTCVIAGPVPVVHLGDAVKLQGTMESAVDLSTGQRAAISTRGCVASLFATSMQVVDSSPSVQRALTDLRTRLGAVLRQSAPGDAGVLLSGLVTGDDDGFSPERKNAFIRTGTTHLTAVSGSNLALVAGILATIGTATVGRHRVPWQFVTILGIWVYALVSGTHPPSLRAAIVATAAVVAFRVGRRPDYVTLILLAAGAMVVVEPRQIESLGFRLSVAASLALVLVLTGLIAKGLTSRLGVVLAATVAAQLATLPILLPTFGTVSLTSVPANIVAVPLVAIAMPLAALAAVTGLIWLPLGEAIAVPAALAATALIGTVDVLGAPQAYISVGVPPLPSAAAIAAAAFALLLVIAGNEIRGLVLTDRNRTLGEILSTGTKTAAIRQLDDPGSPDSSNELGQIRNVALLPPSSAHVLAREDPLDALAAHPDEAEKQPAGEEVGHEFADVGQTGQTFAREIARQLPEAYSRAEPKDDDHEQQGEHKHLTTLAHDRDILATEVVEPGQPRFRRWLRRLHCARWLLGGRANRRDDDLFDRDPL
jgi:competence protein ComEC